MNIGWAPGAMECPGNAETPAPDFVKREVLFMTGWTNTKLKCPAVKNLRGNSVWLLYFFVSP